MAIMKAEWRCVRASETVFHLIPTHDVIDHRGSFTCICNPTIDSEVQQNQSVTWYIAHNSFDEFLDDDLVEPYTGL